MRKIYNLLVVIALVVSFSSCEKDNYDAPEAGVYGQIVDHNGKIFQTAMAGQYENTDYRIELCRW